MAQYTRTSYFLDWIFPAYSLHFAHSANGGGIVSSLVLVNAGANPVRPAIYFYDQDGGAIAAESMLDVPADMEIGDDGALRPGTAMNPLGELTISTHGRGFMKVGSVTATAEGPIGGFLRFDIPGLGVAGVGDSPPVRDALVPVRRQEGGINTGVAVRNQGAAALLVHCRLMRDGAVLEETLIPLFTNGQDSRFIDEIFPTADTSDFVGVGAVPDARAGTLLGGGLRTGWDKPDLHHPAPSSRCPDFGQSVPIMMFVPRVTNTTRQRLRGSSRTIFPGRGIRSERRSSPRRIRNTSETGMNRRSSVTYTPASQRRMAPSRWTCSATPCGCCVNPCLPCAVERRSHQWVRTPPNNCGFGW